jgi:hypothetical protein
MAAMLSMAAILFVVASFWPRLRNRAEIRHIVERHINGSNAPA